MIALRSRPIAPQEMPIRGPAGFERADVLERLAARPVAVAVYEKTVRTCCLCGCGLRPGQRLRGWQKYLCHEDCFNHFQ